MKDDQHQFLSLLRQLPIRLTAVVSRPGLGLGHLVHRHLPSPLGNFGVNSRQIRPGDLQVQDGLPVGFVLGMKDREGFGFVLGAQAVLLARHGGLAVINARSSEQDESLFHKLISLNRETSPVSSAFVNASFGEFQQILASSGE